MSELASYALERPFEDGEFVLSRGVRQGNSTAVLVLSPALEQPRMSKPNRGKRR
jgi:hypothetical protein